jgi:hypothetical protein
MKQGGTSSADLCKRIAARIVEMRSKGTVPWRQPWSLAWPQNLVSREPHRGFNGLFLVLRGFCLPDSGCSAEMRSQGAGIVQQPPQAEQPRKYAIAVA